MFFLFFDRRMVGVLKKFAQQVKQNRQKQHRKKQRNDKRIDIYSDEEEEQNGAGVNASSSLSGKYDEVENYEYHVDVIPQEYDEEIEEEEAFNDEDEERYGIFFTKKTDSDDEEKVSYYAAGGGGCQSTIFF